MFFGTFWGSRSAKKHSKSTLWGALSQVPKSIQKTQWTLPILQHGGLYRSCGGFVTIVGKLQLLRPGSPVENLNMLATSRRKTKRGNTKGSRNEGEVAFLDWPMSCAFSMCKRDMLGVTLHGHVTTVALDAWALGIAFFSLAWTVTVRCSREGD